MFAELGHGWDAILTQANFLSLGISKNTFSLILTPNINSDHNGLSKRAINNNKQQHSSLSSMHIPAGHGWDKILTHIT